VISPILRAANRAGSVSRNTQPGLTLVYDHAQIVMESRAGGNLSRESMQRAISSLHFAPKDLQKLPQMFTFKLPFVPTSPYRLAVQS
jgi:hypothetical protein